MSNNNAKSIQISKNSNTTKCTQLMGEILEHALPKSYKNCVLAIYDMDYQQYPHMLQEIREDYPNVILVPAPLNYINWCKTNVKNYKSFLESSIQHIQENYRKKSMYSELFERNFYFFRTFKHEYLLLNTCLLLDLKWDILYQIENSHSNVTSIISPPLIYVGFDKRRGENTSDFGQIGEFKKDLYELADMEEPLDDDDEEEEEDGFQTVKSLINSFK